MNGVRRDRNPWSLAMCVVVLLCTTFPAQAASFDCERALTIVEKFICETPELSRLDEALSTTYLAAQKSSTRVEQLRREQRSWLVGRNACASKKCVRDAYLEQLERLELSMPVPNEPYSGREPDYQPFKSNYQRFRLLRGTEKEVCTAHVALLRATYFDLPPYCGRSEPNDTPGFEPLTLVHLDDESTMWLHHTLGALFSERADLLQSIAPLSASRAYVEELRQSPLAFLASISPSTFEPPIDIDNDGIPDRIAYWPDHNYHNCGQESPLNKDGTFLRGTRHALALDAQGRIDVTRTRALFGHPFPYVIEQRDKNTGKSTSVALSRYRPLAHMVTFTKYRGTFYFSGMTDAYGWGDFENKRKSDPTLADMLAVYEHRNGKTALQCEIRWIPMHRNQLKKSK
jgi:uncharacterized protein YecT (DUF1311 family)